MLFFYKNKRIKFLDFLRREFLKIFRFFLVTFFGTLFLKFFLISYSLKYQRILRNFLYVLSLNLMLILDLKRLFLKSFKYAKFLLVFLNQKFGPFFLFFRQNLGAFSLVNLCKVSLSIVIGCALLL